MRRSPRRTHSGEVLALARACPPTGSPAASSRSGTVCRVKSVGYTRSSSSHAIGIDTVAAGVPARRERHRERLAPAVLVVVEEDLAGAPAHRPLHRHVLGPLALHVPRDRLRDRAGRVEIEVAHDRQIEMEAGPARRLDERDQAEALQDLADPERQPPRAGEGAPMQLRLLAAALLARVEVRVEIEDDEVGVIEDRPLQRRLGAGELPAPARSRPAQDSMRENQACSSSPAIWPSQSRVARFSQTR